MHRARIGGSPSLFAVSGLASGEEIAAILALASDEDALGRLEITTRRGPHGASWELPVTAHPALEAVAARALEAADLPGASLTHLRLRRTGPGQGHPPHLDDYALDGLRLAATVLIGAAAAERGGATRLLRATPEPLEIALAPGEGVLWYNLRADGSPDPATLHEGAPVEAGARWLLAAFIYAPLASVAAHPEVSPAPPSSERLYVIVDDTPSPTVTQLQRACQEHDVECVLIDAGTFDMACFEPLEPGAMLYRPAITHRACVVEQLLVGPEVATFYPDALGPHLVWDSPTLLLAKHGIPTPRTFHALAGTRAQLRAQVEALGGLPVILKVPGGSLGVGVMRLESWPALFSVVDAVRSSHGARASLMACVEPADHWRVIVVGHEVAAAYLNTPDPDDFRTSVDEQVLENFTSPPPAGVVEAALQATAALGLELGGVDVLAHPSGRVYVLEVNFPCFFGHPWRAAGIDVAGVMLRHLRAKGRALRAPSGG